MSKLKISPNLFLEVAELNKMIKFVVDGGYKPILQSLIKSKGVELSNPNSFRVLKKGGNVATVSAGIAFDHELNMICLERDMDIEVRTNLALKRWLIISRDVHNVEEGVVNVLQDGTVNGVGTKFTEVLRGGGNFPNKIKFVNSSDNTEEYQVVNVIDDDTAVIFGDITPEDGLRYSVIGTFTPGYIPKETDKNIYEYDGCKFRIEDTNDFPNLSDGEFVIASFIFDSNGVMYVSDERRRNEFGLTKNISPISKSGEGDGVENFITLNSVSLFSSQDISDRCNSVLKFDYTFGYLIERYELLTNSKGNFIKLTSVETPNLEKKTEFETSEFNGCLVIDLNTMNKTTVLNNEGNDLYISAVDLSMFNEKSRLVIIPPQRNVEFRVMVNNGLDAFSSVISVDQFKCSVLVPISFSLEDVDKSFEISIQKRVWNNSSSKSKFYGLPVENFLNVRGVRELLAGSSMTIQYENIRVEEKKRNYS